MTNLDKKISKAGEVIRAALSKAHKPALMLSFGKDSMVLFDLLQVVMDIRLPVIFHRDPWWPNKYAFADEIIREHDLEVYDYPPSAVTMWQGKEIMAYTNHYQVGPTKFSLLQMPKNILEPDGRKYLCARDDVLARPVGTFRYPWDLVLIGHKSSDVDQIAGHVPLRVDIKQSPGITPMAAFPLRDWTDEDIWDYTDLYKVRQQPDRYDVKARKELPDKMNNSDYAHVCIACVDRRNPSPSVRCPKLGLDVSNISAQVRYTDLKLDYIGEPAHATD